jgi:UDP-N-acetylglucosamine 2-epimerase (non-hydrolysing)
MHVINVVGARPNLIKMAAIVHAMAACSQIEQTLVHTGQHYDDRMSQIFFDQLEIPRPDVYLGVGSGSHAQQTARVLVEFERIIADQRPDLVLVVGDVNSTLACALVAAKENLRLAHVEAGLRSFNRAMPEEINRILTDALADYLFCTSRQACANLQREGIPEEKIFFVGNVMIDTLLRHRERSLQLDVLSPIGLQPGGYALLTLHRPANVDDPVVLRAILHALIDIQKHIPIMFPVHPRTRGRLRQFDLTGMVENVPGIRLVDPMGYLEFLNAMANSRFVLTDSGGIQEETTVLGVPCLTLRDETERPETVTEGTNRVIGCSTNRVIAESREILDGVDKVGRRPELWDGNAAHRIVQTLVGVL